MTETTKNTNLLASLSPAQREAVTYNEGPHLVIAGAGSGKTRVLTYKIAYLLTQGVPAWNILALTFTNKAAREMKSRIAQLVGEREARYLRMGTFHSVFAKILRQEAQLLGYTADYTIYDTADSKSLLKHIVRELGEDEKQYKVGDLLGKISAAKNCMQSARDYAADREAQTRDRSQRHYRMAEIYTIYQARLRQANAMDFDDLLFNMNILLEQFPNIREKYQDAFQYILVDEYQDTNFSQYLIIKTLAAGHRHICVVGDDAQSIYGFRGADIRNILMFQGEYQGCPIFKLEQNYRSTENIVGAANSLIEHNRGRISKNPYSENGAGELLHVSTHSQDRDEGHFIAEKIYLQHNAEKRSYDDFAILYRTNAQSRVLEDEMRKLALPYRIYGGMSFYQRKEVKDTLAYFRLICNPQDDEALLRIINFPTRGIGDTTLQRVRETAALQGMALFDVVAHPEEAGVPVTPATRKKLIQFAYLIEQLQAAKDELNAYELALEVLDKSRIMQSAILDQTPEGMDRLDNLKELQAAIHEFQQLRFEEGEQQVLIGDFLSEVSLLTDQDEKLNDQSPRVTLMTIHAAKGLEYPVVFIAGLEENLFPSQFCDSEKELEEERRLFYVALTRAKEVCYLSSARSRFKNGQVAVQEPSRFLREIDSRFLDRSEQREVRRPQWNSSWFDDEPAFTSYPSAGRTAYPAARPTPAATPRPTNLKAVSSGVKTDKEPITPPFPIGSRVQHGVFGQGTVLAAYNENGNDKIDIRFDQSGQKTLLLKFAKLSAC